MISPAGADGQTGTDEDVILTRAREMARRLDDQDSYNTIAIRLNHIHEALTTVREQRDALDTMTKSIPRYVDAVPCGDGRCYCGGCVL